MTNENLAIVSAIKSFKLEKDIFKTVIKNLIDKEADENIIAILLNPDLVTAIIDENKYTEALEYVMHSYQQERREIVVKMQLKRYEKKVQGAIEEAKITSIPTMEAASRAGGAVSEAEAKNAKDSAIIFIQDEPKKDKLEEKEAKIQAKQQEQDTVEAPSVANETAKSGVSEIVASLNSGEPTFDEAKKAQDEFAVKNGMEAPKAEVTVPKVTVIPPKEPVIPENPLKEEPKTVVVEEPKKEEKKPEEVKPQQKLDGEIHEVKAVRESSSFFKRHKKAILIGTGIATLAITTVAFPTIIIPTIMSANSTIYLHTTIPAVKTVLHGLNTILGNAIGATFTNGVWHAASGAAINAAAATTCLSSAIATYGLWGVYGKGVVDAVKGLCKGVDMESPKKDKEPKQEKQPKEAKRTEKLFAQLEASQPKKEEQKTVEAPKTEEAKPVVEEPKKEEVKPLEPKQEEIRPVVEKPVPVSRPAKSEDQPESTVADLLREFQVMKEEREKEQKAGGMRL